MNGLGHWGDGDKKITSKDGRRVLRTRYQKCICKNAARWAVDSPTGNKNSKSLAAQILETDNIEWGIRNPITLKPYVEDVNATDMRRKRPSTPL